MKMFKLLAFVLAVLMIMTCAVSAGQYDDVFEGLTFSEYALYEHGTLNAVQLRAFAVDPNGKYYYGGLLDGGDSAIIPTVYQFDAATGDPVSSYQFDKNEDEGAFIKAIAADDRGYVYMGVANEENNGAVYFAICSESGLTEIKWVKIEIEGKVGVNGAAVCQLDDKYYLYFVTNYDTDRLYCYDVTDVKNPVLNTEFGLNDSIGYIDLTDAYNIADANNIAVDEDGYFYICANTGTGSKGDKLFRISADGTDVIATADISECFGVSILEHDYLAVCTYEGADSKVHILNRQDLSTVTVVSYDKANNFTQLGVIGNRIFMADQGADAVLVSSEINFTTSEEPNVPTTAIGIPFVDEGTITVDGQKDAAYDNAVVFDIATPLDTASSNASAKASMMTNNGLLYLYIDVTDPEVNTPVTDMQVNAPWNTDSFEFLFQTHNDEFDDIHQFRIDVSGYASYYMNESGDVQAYGSDADKYFEAYGIRRNETGYIVEMCIDMKPFGVSANETIGIQMQLNDVLNANPNEVGAFYHLKGTAHAFNTEYYTTVYVGSGESYTTTRVTETEKATQTNHGNVTYVSSDAIKVDGAKDSVYADVTPIAVKYEGGQAVTDMTDGNANVYLATNNGFLYVYAEINDTEVVTPTEQQQTEWPWETDSLEMFIHSGDIYQFRVDNTGYPSFYLNPNGDIQAYGPDAASDYFISYADGKIDGGYTVEFCIDLKNFGVSSGTELGINFQLNDRSEDGSQRFIYNGVSDSWNVDMYDRISIGVGESYVASAKPVPPIQKIPESNRGYVKNIGTTPITVDAQMDESVWVNALQIPIDCLNSGENTGTSGIAYLLWAENKWYLTVDVKDADVVVPTEEAQQNHPWTTDSVEIFFDFGNQHKELVKQYRIDCAGYPSYYVETGAHYAYGEAAKPYFGNYAVNITDDGYIIEMCMNMEEYHLIDGYEVGIQLQINDMKGNNPDGAAAVYNMWSAMGSGSWDVHAYDYVTLGGIARGIIPHVGSSAVVVDGEKDAAYTDGMDFAVDTLVAGNDTGTSADAYMLTDNGLLYLYAEIADNDVVDPDPNLQSTEPWFTDSLELFIQEMHSEHIHQFRVDHSNYPSYYMNSDGIRQGYGHDAAAAYMKAYSAKKTDTGYIVEMCIDLKQFAVSAGEEIGIQMQINDRRTNGDQSFYHLNKGGAFDPVYYESAVIGVGEDYAGRDVMLGTSIGDVPYIKPDRIVIDGQYSSVWDNALKVEIDQFNNGDETCGTGATAHMYWTEGKWYLFVDVKDNDVAAPDPIMQENEPWRTDSVEMFFDFGHEHSDLVKQFRIDCSGYPSYYEEHGINYAYGEAAKDYFDEYKVLQDEDGYNIEMVIDLSKWGLAPGDEIGIQLQLNDTTTAHPTEWRSCWNMHQSMGAGSWDAPFYDYVTLKAKPVEEVKPVEIPVTEDKDTPSVKVEEAVVQGSTVTIDKIDESALENVFDAPVEEPDDGEDTGDTETKPTAPANTVTIDVSNVKSEDSAEAEKVQQVTVPATVVDTIKKAAESKNVEDAKLAVHLSTGSIIIDKTTMDVISKVAEAEEGKTTTVSMVIDDADDNLNEVQQTSLENIAEDEVVFGKLEVIMEVTKTDNTTNDTESEKIHDFNGGTVQLEVPFEIPEGYAESGFTVYYLDDDGNLIPMETQYSNGKITWTTGHFSDYIILYKEPTVEEFPEDPVPEMPREPIIVDVDQIVDDLMDSICNQITDISDRLQKTAEDAGKQLVDRLKETAITYVKDKVNDLAQCLNIDLCKLRKDIKYFCNLMP